MFSTKRIRKNEFGVYDEMTNFVASFLTRDAADRAALEMLHDETLADSRRRLLKLPYVVFVP